MVIINLGLNFVIFLIYDNRVSEKVCFCILLKVVERNNLFKEK